MIGNGFDLNLGLDTKYSDFVQVYEKLKTDPINKNIEKFRSHIKNDEDLWSNAEEALGQYTAHLETGQGAAFSECQSDFCRHLAHYLKQQEQRIDYTALKEHIKKAFGQFKNFANNFPSEERAKINALLPTNQSVDVIFDFLNYNYTNTLDKCLKIAKDFPGLLGSHVANGRQRNHQIGTLCHVHGTVDAQMVFGVNDESQIAKPSIFDGEDGDLSKSLLIKKDANEVYMENTDTNALRLIQSSSIIYIYGMALGLTDKLWWVRICKWLSNNENRHVIIQQHEMPPMDAFPYDHLLFLRSKKREFMQLGDLPPESWDSVNNRIHITDYNIFAPIQNIATPLPTTMEDAGFYSETLVTV